MECGKIHNLAIKYELGEVDYIEKKTFESHVKSCEN